MSFLQKLQRSEFFIPILTKNVFVGKVLWRSLYWNFFSFESFVTRYKLRKTSLILISVSISKFSSGLSLLYISFDKLLEFRIVLIKWLLYSAFAMLVDELLRMKKFIFQHNYCLCKVVWTSSTRTKGVVWSLILLELLP